MPPCPSYFPVCPPARLESGFFGSSVYRPADDSTTVFTFLPRLPGGYDAPVVISEIPEMKHAAPMPQVIWTYIDGLKRHAVALIADTVADDLVFVTPATRLNKLQFLEMLRALYAGFPDWHYEHEPPEWQDGFVAVKWRQSGTHTGAFVLPGLTPLRPTGRTVQIPEQYFYYTVRGDRIVEIRPDPIPGGAPAGILQQIGVAAPPV